MGYYNLHRGHFPTTSSGITYETEAQTYFTACTTANGGSDPFSTAVKGYLNTLIKGFKDNGLWSIPYCIYPFPSTIPAVNSVNMKNPGTYNLTFANSPTQDSTGVTFASTKRADTGLSISSIPYDDNHIYFYTGTTVLSNTSGYDGGVLMYKDPAGSFDYGGFWINWNYPIDQKHQFASGRRDTSPTGTLKTTSTYASDANSDGSWMSSRKSGTLYVYRNGSLVLSGARTATASQMGQGSGAVTAYNFELGTAHWQTAYNDTTDLGYSPPARGNIRGYSLGAGFADTQIPTYQSLWNAYQTSMGRNTY